jgi:transcriptional regulator with XRE-family HTH domain
MNFDQKKFSERLQALRAEKNISQKELGVILGITTDSIYNMERGTRRASIDNLCKMSDLFDVSIEYLIGASTEKLIEGTHDYKLDKTIPNWIKKIIPSMTNLTKLNQKAFIALLKGFKAEQELTSSKKSNAKP